jgi:hypothetical protein
VQGKFWPVALPPHIAGDPEHPALRTRRVLADQPLVDVPDLLDIELAEGDAAALVSPIR